jgi:hypothetical protein
MSLAAACVAAGWGVADAGPIEVVERTQGALSKDNSLLSARLDMVKQRYSLQWLSWNCRSAGWWASLLRSSCNAIIVSLYEKQLQLV